MKAYSIKTGDIQEHHLIVLELAKKFFEKMSDQKPDGEKWSCHNLVEAFCDKYPDVGEPIHGRFSTFIQHSWIDLKGNIILDIYPVGGTEPRLQVAKYGLTHLYETFEAVSGRLSYSWGNRVEINDDK